MNREPRHPILLHGFSGSSAAWGPAVIDGMAAAGLTPVLADLPGHGRYAGESDHAAFTLESTLERVAEAGRWPSDLVGYSMGGRIALHFAAEHPDLVRRLVLESASPGLASEAERARRREADEELAGRILRDGVDWFVDFWEQQPIFETRRSADPETLALQRAVRARNDAGSLAAVLRRLGTGALPGLWHVLPEIRTPTLLLAGALDRKFVDVAERMAESMHDARVVVVPGAGHTVHVERPSAWLEAVTGFLRA